MLTSELRLTLLSQLNTMKKRIEDQTLRSQIRRTPSFLSNTILQNKQLNVICLICRKEVQNNQKIMTCSKCKAIFHTDHLTDWLIVKPFCPVCEEHIPFLSKHNKKREDSF